ncbi:MAG: hypothetical protein JNK53_03955, partial [Phycisphaerae bacterium]|nr:hypothetical protein [Phycisphaerae bacterium]
MRTFQLRSDLKRHSLSGFQLPLGLEPTEAIAPRQGFTVEFVEGEDEAPDTFRYAIACTFEKIAPLIRDLFELLPDEVYPLVEASSKDAYRAVDVFGARESTEFDDFLECWKEYEQVILEDGAIGAGAQSDEPYMEIFVDAWKVVAAQVPAEYRDDVERILERHNIEQVEHTWPPDVAERPDPPLTVREILVVEDEDSPDIDEILFQLRESWALELEVDPEDNMDDAGRRLGRTLWYSIAVVVNADESESPRAAYVLAWATAASLGELQRMILARLEEQDEWTFAGQWYSQDRVAFDERPDALADLAPRRPRSEIHLFS